MLSTADEAKQNAIGCEDYLSAPRSTVLFSSARDMLVALRRSMGRDGIEMGATVGRLGIEMGATVGRLGIEMGATVGRLGIEMGATVGRLGIEMGATVGRLGIEMGATVEGMFVAAIVANTQC